MTNAKGQNEVDGGEMADSSHDSDQDRKRRKLTPPQRRIAVLALMVLALGLGNLVRAVRAVYYASHLPDLPMTVSWTYQAVTGAFWCVALLVCAVALLRVWPWARWATLAAVTLYQAHVWVDHLLFDANARARQLLPCDAALTLGLLVFVWVVLNLPGVRKEFRTE
jgi:hypothetical protein